MNATLNSLPQSLFRENVVKFELEQGVLIFRATATVRERITELLEKEKTASLSSEELKELNAYEEIDDYLSYINRLIRNSAESNEVNLAA